MDMIYLDNAATTLPKPAAVIESVNDAMKNCASIGRSGHPAAQRAADIAFACRQKAGAFFDLPPDQVVFTMNATHGLNLAIASLVHPGDHVVISGFEHNAVIRPLIARGAVLQIAGRRVFDPEDTILAFQNAITEHTSAVICTHVSNVFGYVLPIEKIAQLCADRGIPFILDASQSAGILPVRVSSLQAAFVAVPGHKGLYGPQGTGLLLCGRLPNPMLFGGTGSMSRSAHMPDFLPDRMEAGTQNTPGIAGLLAGLRFIESRGIHKIRAYEQNLLEYAKRALEEVPGIQIYSGSTEQQVGVLSFQSQKTDCQIMAEHLSDAGFAVRAGLHCAPVAHESVGTLATGTVRISVSAFNSKADIADFGACLQKIGNR